MVILKIIIGLNLLLKMKGVDNAYTRINIMAGIKSFFPNIFDKRNTTHPDKNAKKALLLFPTKRQIKVMVIIP